MKFLIDNALPPNLAALLRDNNGLDAVHVREYNMQRASDERILERAEQEHRTVVSADTDFGTLLALRGSHFPSCILFRDPDLVKAEHYHAALVQVLTVAESEIEKGCVIVVRHGRLRIRTLPLLTPQS